MRTSHLLSTIIALVVLLYLAVSFLTQDVGTGSECTAKTQLYQLQLSQWRLKNPISAFDADNPPVPAPKCPEGGTILLSETARVYCSRHNPMPGYSPTPTPPPAIDFTR